jgi:chorismate mutase
MSIDDWRGEIDGIDREIIRLLNARARIAIKVGTLKRATGVPLCDPTREMEVMKQVHEWNQGPLDARALARLFRRIIYESRRLEAQSAESNTPVRVEEERL